MGAIFITHSVEVSFFNKISDHCRRFQTISL